MSNLTRTKILILLLASAACDSSTTVTPATAAFITVNPSDQLPFEGQVATFTVTAVSDLGVDYQWYANGVAIAGATSARYTTPITTAADDGTIYDVTVTTSGPDLADTTVTSADAKLTVQPPVDWRFKGVGRAITRPGGSITIGLPGSLSYGDSVGSPVSVGVDVCATAVAMDCAWGFGVQSLAAGMQGPDTAYLPGTLASLGADVTAGYDPNRVIMSMDLEADAAAYALVTVTSDQKGQFGQIGVGSAPLGDLQGIATQHGANGVVLTAVSMDGGVVSYIGHDWSEARNVTYEASVVTATPSTIADAATSLGDAGYIITAVGAGDEGTNGFILIGTRPTGSTTPHPVMTMSAGTAFDNAFIPGYTTVGLVWETQAEPAVLIIGQQ